MFEKIGEWFQNLFKSIGEAFTESDGTGSFSTLERIIMCIVLILISWLIIKLICAILKKALGLKKASSIDKSAKSFIISIIKFMLWLFVAFLVISILGINITSFAGILSAVTVALGLSLQDVIASFASGVIILNQKYFLTDEWGYTEAIIITLSSYLGGTFNAIKLVGKEFEDKLKITMIDSKTTCFCEGMLAIQAQELVNKGVPTEQIIKELNWSINHQEFLGTCNKLDYLIYNGRLKGGKAFMGKMLSIVPVMHFSREGVLEPIGSALGLRKGINTVIDVLEEKIGNRDPNDYYLWHNYTGESSMDLLKEIEEERGIKCNHEDVIASPVTGCHTGPYLSGYGLFMKRREDEPLD